MHVHVSRLVPFASLLVPLCSQLNVHKKWVTLSLPTERLGHGYKCGVNEASVVDKGQKAFLEELQRVCEPGA